VRRFFPSLFVPRGLDIDELDSAANAHRQAPQQKASSSARKIRSPTIEVSICACSGRSRTL
jgi:hypothetical protein